MMTSSFHTVDPPEVPPAPEAPPVLALASGKPSGQRYRRVSDIATGGMGQVDECYDAELRRRVAVKRLSKEARAHDYAPVLESMLDREARITASLEHPSIIPIYDAASDENGRYYVMRLVTQQTLADVLEALVAGVEGKFTLRRLLRDFALVCRAVAYAHSRGVVHCDLKPANIMLGPFGEVLIVDWGMAYSVDDDFVPRGGTPAYMSPEQLDTTRTQFDASSDIFSLGAVLYELLCLVPPFGVSSASESLAERKRHRSGLVELAPPSARSGDRDVPPELEQVALRAMALDPGDRWASANEIAHAVDEFLEGKQELERRQREANALTRSGDELAPRYHELVESRPEQMRELAAMRRDVQPWAPAAEKSSLWALEDRVAVMDALRVRTLHAAAALYEQALEVLPDHRRARWRLAQLYSSELRLARERRDQLAAIHFEELVRQFDDTAVTADSSSGGSLRVDAPPGCQLGLAQLMSRDRRSVPAASRRLLTAPTDLQLARGSYILTADLANDRRIHVPLRVTPEHASEVRIESHWEAELRHDELLIAGGTALLGEDIEHGGANLAERWVPTFAMKRFPVTFAEYLQLVADIANSGADIQRWLPQTTTGEAYWSFDGDQRTWRPTATLDAEQDALALPVFGIDVTCAMRFATWSSQRDGVRYRLPTAEEWEKAARGVDGRTYPWGDYFDASFCKMRDSRPGTPRPEVAEAFPLDISPYGVCALAGTIAEWVSRGDGGFSARGGAWGASELDCRVSSDRAHDRDSRSPHLGMRLVRDVEGNETLRASEHNS